MPEPAPGKESVKLNFRVERDADHARDAVEIDLPIRPDRLPVRRYEIVEIAPGESKALAAATDAVRPGSFRRDVTLAGDPTLVKLVAGLNALVEYPYGCTEQRLSLARSALALKNFTPILSAAGLETRLSGDVRNTIRAIDQAVDADGLVAFWPRARGNVSLTAWAYSFLVSAERAGEPIDKPLADRLANVLKPSLRSDYPRLLSGEELRERVEALIALAEGGKLSDLVFAKEQTRRRSIRVMSSDTARLVTSMLADPLARLPSFPRYGPLEYPFAVAVKTGTSQAYRDAWTIAFSRKAIVGVWVGRGDAGAMNRLSGASSSARLAHAALTLIHGARPGETEAGTFPAPRGRAPMEMCLAGGRSDGSCGETLVEWVKPERAPSPPVGASSASRPAPLDENLELAIATPENRTHIWRNPEQPAALDRLALRVSAPASVEQILWMVDGRPFQLADADKPAFWPMQPGTHRFQARLPLRPGGSRVVEVTIE